ncbi:MAG: DUF2270 domain-containing protein [Anaerolineae bacterium]
MSTEDVPREAPASSTAGEHDAWSFRGYHMRAGEFTAAMSHFYRGELGRSNTWRLRLDTTTNWAVVTTGATLSLAFGGSGLPHAVILLDMILVGLFWWMEARRYRYYELWASRVRLMETDFFAAMLIPPFAPGPHWADKLASSLLTPEFPITILEALGRRFRRNYQWIFILLGLAWLANLALFPVAATDAATLVARASIGSVDGSLVMLSSGLAFVLIFLVGWLTLGLRQTTSEVLPHGVPLLGLDNVPLRLHRRERLAIIITSQGEAVARGLMGDLHRGVTSLTGTGMFTGEARQVLLCALTPRQTNELQRLVRHIDPSAFIIINQVHEILGKGFESFTRK